MMKTPKSLLKSQLGPSLGLWRRIKWRVKPPERELFWLSKIIRLCQLKKEGAFIDIGACFGLYSITTSKVFETILAIEANPSLCETLVLSGVPHNVTVENLAISNVDGYAELRIPIIRGSGGKNLGEATIAEANTFRSDDYSGFEQIQVKCTTLDKLVAAKYSDRDVVAIKIDIEGNEAKAIEGALQTISKQLPILLIEMEYRYGANIEQLFECIASLGYTAFRISQSGRNLLPTRVHEIRELQSDERWQKKKRDPYSTEYVNNYFFIPRRLKSKLSEVIAAV